MEIKDLHRKLKEAYSNQNLTRISITLIHLYKDKQYGTLGKIATIISETYTIETDPEARYFSKLMMLYHPDRGNFHRQEIDRLFALNDYKGLSAYTHILSLEGLEEIAATLGNYEDIDYSPVYEWDINTDDFTIITGDENPGHDKKHRKAKRSAGLSFYDAVKIRMYGNTQVEFPPYYLEDIEEVEMAQSGIDDLDGVQYCIHAVSLDLSGNAIEDITWLWGLKLLQEINLSDNRITELDTLSNLKNLRTLNLSGNTISDISPLMNLENLEYLDISGTKISPKQSRMLEELGVTVIRDQ